MGPDRAPWLYRGRSFLDHGVRLVGSSDQPVTPASPLRSIQFMVQRATSSGQLIGPDEAITVSEALRAWTVEAARACHREDSVGSIAPGRHADLVVLADDPCAVTPDRIADIEVVSTLVDGVVAAGAAVLG